MIVIAAWALLVLGIAHVIYGISRFRQPLKEAIQDGFVGQFAGIDSRRLAFWFLIVGPLVAMGGQVALHAARIADLELLRMTGYYMLAISIAGVLALPKSPFWIALALSPIFIAAGHGWIAS